MDYSTVSKNLRRLRRFCRFLIPGTDNPMSWDISYSYSNVSLNGKAVNEYLRYLIENDEPCLVTRFGTDVLMCAMDSTNRLTFSNAVRLLKGETNQIGLREWTRKSMCENAGFFPDSEKALYDYGDLIVSCLPSIDLLGSWMDQERYFSNEMDNCHTAKLEDLEPWFYDDPWTRTLRGKKVLVIHPFESSILEQYGKRSLLFENQNILPEFELKTIRAVQSIAGNKTRFKTWFDALHWMMSEIDKIDFDIAIIGCGAYGMPLGKYIKDKGKKAIHLGGVTQLLFGIIGRRWEEDNDKERSFYRSLFNEHWIHPLPEDVPQRFETIENGCYW